MRSSSPTFGRQNKRKTFSRRGVTFGTFPLHPLWIHQTWSPVLIAAVSSVKVPLNDIFPNVPTCATTRLPRRKHKSPESVADTRTASLLILSGRPIFLFFSFVVPQSFLNLHHGRQISCASFCIFNCDINFKSKNLIPTLLFLHLFMD